MSYPPRRQEQSDAPDDRLERVDPASIPPTTWRSEIRGASGLNALLAIWLILSPWILDYRSGDPTWVQFVLADALGLMAVLRATAAWWDAWMSWANVLLGAAIFLVGLLLAESGQATLNAMAGGGLAILLAAFSAAATDSAKGPPEVSGRPSSDGH